MDGVPQVPLWVWAGALLAFLVVIAAIVELFRASGEEAVRRAERREAIEREMADHWRRPPRGPQ